MLRSQRQPALFRTSAPVRRASEGRDFDPNALAARGLFLLSAALMGALLYLGTHWPAAVQAPAPAPVAASPVSPVSAASPLPQASSASSSGGLAVGTLISQGARSVNAAAQNELLAEQARRAAAAAAPSPAAARAATSPPAQAAVPAHAPSAAVSASPAPAVSAAPASANTIAAGRAAPADSGPLPSQRASGQPAPNHIIVPATVPPTVRPH
jgi:ribonuclease E